MKKYVFIILLISVSIASAQTDIPGGDVFGTWTSSGSPYLVQGSIAIPADSTLNIEPGVEVAFQGNYSFTIYGYLQALGTEVDSIHFNSTTDWQGLSFSNAPDSSHLAYCAISGGTTFFAGIQCDYSNPVITHSRISGFSDLNHWGGGIELSHSNPEISYCTITGNSCWSHGAGIYCFDSEPVISHCNISGNNAGTYGGMGGGIYVTGSNITVSNCTINDNYADHGGGLGFYGSSGTISDCVISGDSTNASGGGIYIQTTSADITITNTTISHCESGPEGGAGIFIHTIGTLTMEGCTIDDNNAAYSVWGGGMHVDGCDSLIIDHCNVLNNYCQITGSGIALYDDNTNLIVTNSIFKGQDNNDILFTNSALASVSYSNFDNQLNMPFSNPPTGLGTLMQTNANGDSCDVFYNIYLDPLFVDFENADYNLTEDSPCIDAGDPESPYDPDSTICDMGVFYYDQDVGIDDITDVLPAKFSLSQNYPNPFNNSTVITYQLPYSSQIKIEIYNILGRRISKIQDDIKPAGYHQTIWNAEDISSGVYFYKIQAGDCIETKKMLLVK